MNQRELRMKKVGKCILYLLGMTGFCMGALLLEALQYKEAVFGNVTFEQIYFSVTGNMQGANMSVFSQFYLLNLPLTIAICAIFTVIIAVIVKKWLPRKFRTLMEVAYAMLGILFLGGILYHGLNEIGAIAHYKMLSAESSTLYEDYYVDPNTAVVKFPEEKKNLIYIFCESMENTYMVDHCGGAQDINFIPNLTELMYQNTSFWNPEDKNGALVEYGCDWTVAAMLAQSTGIPMCMPNGQNEYEEYTTFLPGVTGLGDILEAEGYQLELMIGSDSAFGGRNSLYKTHGNHEIFDYYTAIDRGYIDEDYYVWWGFEDRRLFDYAKEELGRLAGSEEPFALTLLTADTHYIEGYVDELGEDFHKDSYQNALSNSDVIITDFVNWLSEQDYYDDTVIVIAGDHLNMGGAYISQLDPAYQRTVFSTIINSQVSYDGEKPHTYTTLDFFPTTLASMGCEIPGNRLGLGTNLFSDEPTLVETLGYDRLYNELSRPSAYYEKNFVISKERAAAYR